MTSRFLFALLFFIIFISLLDLYLYKAMTVFSEKAFTGIYKSLPYLHGIIPLVMVTWIFLLILNLKSGNYLKIYHMFYLFGGFFVLLYMPKIFFALFHLLEDLIYLGVKGIAGIWKTAPPARHHFLWLSYPGLAIGGIIFILVLHGHFIGRFNFQITRHERVYPALPTAFHGTKIVQISDFHIGGFKNNPAKVEKIIRLINKEQPDLVLFTGDLVNVFSEEAKPFVPLFQKIEAKMGKFAILGNHDYGEYFAWNTREEELENQHKTVQNMKDMGFDILLNEHRVLQKNGDSIAIIGVENWGEPPFAQYGDLEKALQGAREVPFKILLTHDPSHWKGEVLEKSDIELSLSGHTHGMQFGFKLGAFQWSPSKYKYPEWSGWYTVNGQDLYVNRGIGTLGCPCRVGMYPEITVIELKSHE
jgi:hypothetical protein